MRSKHLLILATAVCATLLWSCTPKKNTAATRNYQAFITRYNIYFNGDEHYKETLKSMETGYEDDFTKLIPMHPAEARDNKDAPQPNGDFTRSIEKAQKAIQLRSIKKRPQRTPGKSRDPEYREWLKREEYNPFIHNAWMLMARSRYMNGDFLGAASTFMYIARHFTWLPQTVTEAKIWQARSYCAAGWLNEARAILDRVKPKELTDATLKGLYAFTDADILISSGNYAEAVAPLREAIETSKGIQRTRLTFLLGQILQRTGDNTGATEAYSKVSSGLSTPYRIKFNARIRQGATASGKNIESELKAIRGMAKYERNKEFLDQIYHAEGNLLLAKGDTIGAVKAYTNAVAKSTRQGIDMAIANLTLGALYFDLGDYDKAQTCYAASVTMIGNDYPDIDKIKLRSDVLDELAVHSRNVHLQDSLLALADMTEEQRLEVVNRIIADLVRREKEEAEEQERQKRDEEDAARESDQSAGENAKAPTAFTLNTDNSWYFYNQNVKNAGANEFRRRWGGRKLEDNWRRRNKNDFAMVNEDPETVESTDSTITAEENTETKQNRIENDPHNPQFYLKDIPQTPEQRNAAHEIIQEGLYNMGLILKDKLEDYPAAEKPWLRLLAEYPDNVYRLDTYYNMYLMYMRMEDMAQAEKYRQLILSQFAESPLGAAMTDPQYLDNLKEMPRKQEELYGQAYTAFLENKNSDVLLAVETAQEKYPLSPLMPKFLFLGALTNVSEGNTTAFLSDLRTIVERYPDADVTPLASAYIKGATSGKKLSTGLPNRAGMIRSIRLTDDSGAELTQVADTVRMNLDPDVPQMLLLSYPLDSVNANEILYDVARFNFNTFNIRDFDLEQLEFGNLGILLIKGFANIGEVSRYRAMLEGSGGISLPVEVVPIVVSEENFAVILRNGLTLDMYIRAAEEAASRGVHEAVLSPDEYPEEEEMYGSNDQEEE
ncbi:MAG: tetratricopeptide repeat protein [Paramuribaculum sp.]|nr:tetratricopeptide repeat protein [Paramuribaculum sp.]